MKEDEMSEKCVHEWYYRIVDIISWQFFCIRCGEKLSMDNFSNRATELEKNADALNARIAELEKDNDEFRQLIHDWTIILTPDDGYVPDSEGVRQAMLVIDKESEK